MSKIFKLLVWPPRRPGKKEGELALRRYQVLVLRHALDDLVCWIDYVKSQLDDDVELDQSLVDASHALRESEDIKAYYKFVNGVQNLD